MPQKRSLAFNLAKALVLGQTITCSDDDSVEISSEVTPSVQRQLCFSPTSLPTTQVSPTTPDMTSSHTETSTPTSGPHAVDIRINSCRNCVEPTVQSTEQPVRKKVRRGLVTGKALKRDIANNEIDVSSQVEANKHRASDVAPHLATIVETTTNEDRKRLVEEAIEKIKDDSLNNSSDSPMHCPIEKEISIIEEIVGPSVGTVVRGMGSLTVRAPSMRGSMKGTSKPVSTVNEDDLQQQLAERDEEIRLLK
ncbi:hypothetical protein OSB04_001707 [Centaurea solstitialis]|uniref:Uncharacterized protein n=1 Tax=Centaurea solstitialis TaxID=347529 RepID=A0AA38U443_9ASTR|nr:hypothetical protein OSB04_001707 [Centaurea solstitialis]